MTALAERLERHQLTFSSFRRAALAFPIVLYAMMIALRAVPVVFDMKATEMQVIEHGGGRGAIRAHVYGMKIRDCMLIGASKSGEVHTESGGHWYEVGFEWWKDRSPDSNRPRSAKEQDFGWWEWRIDHDDVENGVRLIDIDRVRLNVVHHCDGFFKTTTIGPFIVGDQH